MAGRGSVLGCWEIEHTDIERAVAAKCPIEMGGYDSLEQLQQVWDTRCPNDSAPMTNKDANNADALRRSGSVLYQSCRRKGMGVYPRLSPLNRVWIGRQSPADVWKRRFPSHR